MSRARALTVVVLLGLLAAPHATHGHGAAETTRQARRVVYFTAEDDQGGPKRLYRVNADGSGLAVVQGRALRAARTPGPTSFTWSPNGRRVAFLGGENDREIWVANGDFTNPRKIATFDFGLWTIAWSPAGGRLAYRQLRPSEDSATNQEWIVGVIGANGTDSRVLARVDEAHDLSWSNDGRSLAFSGYDRRSADPIAWNIWVIDVASGALRQVTSVDQPETCINGLFEPIWSANDSRIALTGRIECTREHKIYLTSPEEGSALLPLDDTQDFAVSIKWRPSTSQVAYSECEADGTVCQVHIANTKGAVASRVLVPGSETRGAQPRAWSADGALLAYYLWDGASSAIGVIRADGSDEHLLFDFERFTTIHQVTWRP